MKQLILLITHEAQQHQLMLDSNKSYTIGQSEKNSIVLPESGEQVITIHFDEDKQLWCADEQTLLMTQAMTIPFNEGALEFFLSEDLPKQAYSLLGLTTWRIGQDAGAMITLADEADTALLFEKQKMGWQLMIANAPIYVNFQLATGSVHLTSGDQLTIAHQTYTIYEDEIHVAISDKMTVQLPALALSAYTFYEDYPDYHRSPRLIYRDPEEKITLAPPDSAPSKNNQQLLKTILPPLLMLGMTIAMNFIQPRGPYVLITAATTVMTLVFSVTNYFKQNKKFKQDVIDRKRIYEEYLTEKSKEIYSLALEQRQGRLYHYPSMEELAELGAKFNHRIYEKTALHHDFLTYRLGLGDVKLSSEVSYSGSEGQKKLDEIEQEGMNLWRDTQKVSNVPVTTDLISGPLGYIGPRKLVIEQLHLLVNQLSFFHSYHDLQMISIFPEDELPQWNWMRFLPHAKLQEMNVRGFVYHQRSRDQVLNSLTQILKNRKNALDEKGRGGENTIFTPHYVVMITDEKLILDHAIMEFFNEDPSNLGCSIIFVQDVMSSLPENIQTIIDVRDSKTGMMVLEKNELKNIRFELDHFPADFDKEKLPRILAPLNHLQNLKNSIPEAITFLEMYEVDKFEDLNVQQRWAAHSPHKSLAVPLGVRGKEDIVYLNLHEKAHGPHGLVAGTTGSGKSEIVQSYILSLAVNFHPYEVAFLLIDYKGGGMANLFRNLPHLLGSITNLDGAQSMRALISINAELKRRQRLFSENNVNHINQYQKLYKDGDVSEPMPHLFLISDEFAELKSEQPEFMKELVSTARIGRSLGIHLILATQKPSGVVDDQIWSNSKFKLALKVADKSDSMEMLKTPDAAEITQPGRAYLQVGNNEIYELFQSAWSGADYLPDQSDQEEVDNTIYAINDLGQYEILSEDLSGLSDGKEVKTVPTELDAVIDGIHAITEEAGIAPLPRPWLPPLAERVYLPELDTVDYKVAWQEKSELEPMLGIA
ncbi:type VII secretion protein EssC, partial [Isobaculum melis]